MFDFDDDYRDMLRKRYIFIANIKILSEENHWNKSGRNIFGIYRRPPDGIKKLRSLLATLPSQHVDENNGYDIMESALLINNLYSECMTILSEKQTPYNGFGKRKETTQDFYRSSYKDGLKIKQPPSK